MNVTKSLNNLAYKFRKAIKHDNGEPRKDFKPLYVTKQDIHDLNNIASHLNALNQNLVSNYTLFSKMLLKRLEYEIWRTQSYEVAIDAIERELEVDISAYYKTFQIDMMMFNFDQACKMLDVPDELDYTKGVSVEQKKAHTKKVLKSLKDNQVDLKKSIISQHWNEENTKNRLDDLITNLISKYGNR